MHIHRGVALVYLAFLLVSAGAYASAQQVPVPPRPVPTTPGLLPPRQEQVLSPIPEQFDWMSREVRPNPLLEALLELQGRPPRLFISGALTEEYSDNFFQTARNRQDEYRTELGIGTVYRLVREPSFISLANVFSIDYRARAEQAQVGYANLSLSAGHHLPQLWLALSASFIRDDRVEDASPGSLRSRRSTFLRNSVTPQLRYDFSPTTSGTLAYTNTLVLNQDQALGNTLSHVFTAGLQHQFTRLLSGSVRYAFTTTAATEVGDAQTHSAAVDLEYTFGRNTRARLQTSALLTERSDTRGEAHTYEASVGVRQQFTPSLGAFVALGATVFNDKNNHRRLFPHWQVNLESVWTRHLRMTLSGQQNVTSTEGEVDNVGLVSRQSVILSLHHTVSHLLSAAVLAEFTHTELLEDLGTSALMQGRKDNFWRVGARASYALTPTMALSVAYFHQQRTSNLTGGDFDENRFTVVLSAGVPVF